MVTESLPEVEFDLGAPPHLGTTNTIDHCQCSIIHIRVIEHIHGQFY